MFLPVNSNFMLNFPFLCLCFRGCISNRHMMDSMLSPEQLRMWALVLLSQQLDTPTSWFTFSNSTMTINQFPFFFSNFCLCSLRQTSVRRSTQGTRWSKSTTRQWWAKNLQTQHITENYFPCVSTVRTYCKLSLFSIVCYVEEMSLYMMSAANTTTTTAAMVLPVLCLCRYVG